MTEEKKEREPYKPKTDVSDTIVISKDLAKRALVALVEHGTHEEFDWPGDAPESCGWWCDICKQHIDDEKHAVGHADECPITRLRTSIGFK